MYAVCVGMSLITNDDIQIRLRVTHYYTLTVVEMHADACGGLQ